MASTNHVSAPRRAAVTAAATPAAPPPTTSTSGLAATGTSRGGSLHKGPLHPHQVDEVVGVEALPLMVRATFQRRVEPLQKITAPDGTRVLVILLLENEADFWLDASSASLDEVWDNAEEDRYARLLEA